MKRKTSGFTILEMMFVIVIGSILVTVALSSFQNVQSAFAARSGKNMYSTLHQRARTRSIELGRRVYVVVNTDGDSAFIVDPGGTGVTDVTHFRRQLNVDLRATPANFVLCMTPRGYANPACGGVSSQVKLEFWRGADSTSLTILPMGQLVGL